MALNLGQAISGAARFRRGYETGQEQAIRLDQLRRQDEIARRQEAAAQQAGQARAGMIREAPTFDPSGTRMPTAEAPTGGQGRSGGAGLQFPSESAQPSSAPPSVRGIGPQQREQQRQQQRQTGLTEDEMAMEAPSQQDRAGIRYTPEELRGEGGMRPISEMGTERMAELQRLADEGQVYLSRDDDGTVRASEFNNVSPSVIREYPEIRDFLGRNPEVGDLFFADPNAWQSLYSDYQPDEATQGSKIRAIAEGIPPEVRANMGGGGRRLTSTAAYFATPLTEEERQIAREQGLDVPESGDVPRVDQPPEPGSVLATLPESEYREPAQDDRQTPEARETREARGAPEEVAEPTPEQRQQAEADVQAQARQIAESTRQFAGVSPENDLISRPVDEGLTDAYVEGIEGQQRAPVDTQRLLQQREDLARLAQIQAQSGTADGNAKFDEYYKQIQEIDTRLQYLQGMQGVNDFRMRNDPQRLSAVWSAYSGSDIQIQPRTDGNYNIFIEGQLTQEGVDQSQIVSAAKLAFSEEARNQLAETQAAQAEIQREAQLARAEEMAKAEADAAETQATFPYDVALQRLQNMGTPQITEDMEGNPIMIYRDEQGNVQARQYQPGMPEQEGGLFSGPEQPAQPSQFVDIPVPQGSGPTGGAYNQDFMSNFEDYWNN